MGIWDGLSQAWDAKFGPSRQQRMAADDLAPGMLDGADAANAAFVSPPPPVDPAAVPT